MAQELRPNIPRIKSVPDLVRKEAVAALISLLAVCLLAACLDAPLQGPANPASAPVEQIKAPWIFVGIQQALRYLPPLLAGVLLPFGAVLTLSCLPYLRAREQHGSRVLGAFFFGMLFLSISLTLWGYWS